MSLLQATPLTMWKDLTPLPRPLVSPSPNGVRILIVGGGVIGLVTAWVLLDRGYMVTIVSKEWASLTNQQRLTSQIAGALWEYPPAVCGSHTDETSLHRSKHWCMIAYHIWDAIAAVPELSKASGVRMMPATFFFPKALSGKELAKMEKIQRSGVRGFRHDVNLTDERSVCGMYGVTDAYEHIAPIIDTDQGMMWLTDLVRKKGATMITESINGDLRDQEDTLRKRFQADMIVNAAGLHAGALVGDNSCYPLRGALIRLINDGTDFDKINAAMSMGAHVAKDNAIIFIVPRNDNILILGGIAEPHQPTLDLTLESPVIKNMRERCEAFLPCLKDAKVDPDYPIAQGLRPARPKNIRLERELRASSAGKQSRIIHSYGHGGSGWSLSFGCAADVAVLVKECLADIEPKPIASWDDKSKTVALNHQCKAFSAKL